MPHTRLQKLRIRLRDAIRRPHRAVIELLVIWKVPEFFDRLLDLLPAPIEKFFKKHIINTLLNMQYKRELVPAEKLIDRYEQALKILRERLSPDQSFGDYLEFGVYQGTSMSCFHQALQTYEIKTTRLFGFDSFDGLPASASEDDAGTWIPGQFKSSYDYTKAYLTRKGINWDRTFLVKGWFSDTLNDDLIEQHRIEKASVIMVDCDIYTSSKQALDFCIPLIQDHAIIFFDDWHYDKLDERNMGEKRAFDEILEEHPHLQAEPLDDLRYHDISKVFLVSALQT